MVSLQPPILLPSSPFPSRSIPRLSPELIDTIIDYLHDDKSTLCRFALVSRRWVRSTRFHLFHHIRVLASDEHPGREFTPFVQFLCHNAHIGPFIRELEFCGSEARSDISLCDGFGILDDEQFLPILQRLPYLHTVILNQVSIIAPDSSRWTELVVPLRKLVFSEIYSDCDGLLWLTHMLPPNTFHILDPIPVPRKLLPAFQLSPPDTLPLLRHLDALVVESRNDPMALGKIDGLMPFSMPDLNSLELTLELDGRDQIARLEAFIESKGKKAKHLRLDIGDIEIFQKEPDKVDLAVLCPELQSLHICFFSSWPSDLAVHWSYGARVIAKAPPTLRRITVGMVTANDSRTFAPEMDWKSFETTLLEMKELEYIRFQSEGDRDGFRTTAECAQPLDSVWQDSLTKNLPSLQKKGLLKFLE
ncbi:hypothetical protein BXZ70DRAFT_458662 [Cristinia sonorae]|uniref:F-box domain-containing protein n=1 Tax=Cristinia sonorae TaxID=1940300 RepID=A0A8K0UHU8_9AGAR|nr:hypothetical protein BXZ70DRAFT_458662 [Cristinia sonorae]